MYKQVKFNIKQNHHDFLSKKAIDKNLSLSEYIRQQLNIDLKDKSIVKKSRAKKHQQVLTTDPRLLYHLSSIGNNINQIAKKVNSSKDIEASSILGYLINIQRQIDDYRN